MEFPIPHDAFEGRGLLVRTPGLFSGARLVLDGAELRGKRGRFKIRDNQGVEREFRFKSNGLDPIPRIEIEGEVFHFARPLRWYEYVWMGLPIFLVFSGGALGAALGLAATYTSARVFRSERNTSAKYLLSALISIGAVVAFVVIVLLIQLLFTGADDAAA